MRFLNLSVALSAAFFFPDQAFSCSVAQRADFAKAGYSKSEIESMCKGSGSSAGPVKQGGANNFGLSTKFDYRGTWNPIECHAFSKTESKIVQVSDDVCKEIVKNPQPFTLGEILFNKTFRFTAVQEGNIVVLEPDQPRINWPLKFEIISNDRIRVKIPDTAADLFGRAPAYRLYARAGEGSSLPSTPTRIAGTAKGSPADHFFGLWKRTGCEFWKNGTQLNAPCTPRGEEFFVEFKQSTLRFGKREGGVEYIDAGLDAVDVKNADGELLRFQKLSPDTISTFIPDKANDRQVRVILTKVGDGAVSHSEQPRADASLGKLKIDDSQAGKLFTTTAPIDVYAEPKEGSRKLATYQPNAMMSTLGDVVGTDFMYVAPCNACEKGYIRKSDFLRKASQ